MHTYKVKRVGIVVSDVLICVHACVLIRVYVSLYPIYVSLYPYTRISVSISSCLQGETRGYDRLRPSYAYTCLYILVYKVKRVGIVD